jgi:hypothetical protein
MGGVRLWPAVFVGAFIVNVTTSGSVLTCLGIAAGNTLEAVVGATLVRRYANGSAAFAQPRTIVVFTAAARPPRAARRRSGSRGGSATRPAR